LLGKEHFVSHPITSGLNQICFNNSCVLGIDHETHATPVVRLPDTQETCLFAVAAEVPLGSSSGRVVVVADSGLVGEDDTNTPGPGLIGRDDNRTFLSNIIEWLLKQPEGKWNQAIQRTR
jgi:hypothetical protein